MKEKFLKFITSSDGKTISLRIKSASALIIFALAIFGFQTNEIEIGELADSIGQIIAAGGIMFAAAKHIQGWAKANFIKKYGVANYEKSLEE